MPDDKPKGGPLRAIVGPGLIALLIVGMLFVVQQLRHAAALQDCLASGRRNCAPVSDGRSGG